MPHTTAHVSISLDGFIAGPEQSIENPLGVGGLELHRWHLGDERATEADDTAGALLGRPQGAVVMGRNMFGPARLPEATSICRQASSSSCRHTCWVPGAK